MMTESLSLDGRFPDESYPGERHDRYWRKMFDEADCDAVRRVCVARILQGDPGVSEVDGVRKRMSNVRTKG